MQDLAPNIPLPYGQGQMFLDIPAANLLRVLYPQEATSAVDEDALLRSALEEPIGTQPLRQLVRKGQKLAIITSDITRPTPSARMLAAISEELSFARIPDADVTLVIATGLHRPLEYGEIDLAISPEFHRRFNTINHDPNDTVRLGVTSRGTPVEIFRPVVDADVRICLGNIELHYYAGFSGGAKAVLPGCASRLAIAANHSWMVYPEAAAGRLDDNPVRLDLEEGAAMVGIDFILNVVVDGHHRIQGAFAGDVTAAHRRGCDLALQRGSVKIPHLGDIVIASAGGFPKDIDFYQGHKALEVARYFVRDGGIIILAAECSEGYGSKVFERWMLDMGSPDEVLEKIRRGFVLGGHKAASIATILHRAQIFMVSAMPDDIIRRSHFTPFASVNDALQAALDELGRESQALVLPQVGSILPDLQGQNASSLT